MVSFLLVLGHDVEAEPLVDGVRDALDARLDLERLVGEHLRGGSLLYDMRSGVSYT